MIHARSESELSTLRKQAQDFAVGRKERPTTVHLLAAIASRSGPAADLLRDRRLECEGLLKAGRSFDEDRPDSVARAITAAQELAKRALVGHRQPPAPSAPSTPASRSGTRPVFPEPTALHLLLALLGDRRSAAHRALLQSGVDIAKLRTSAMQLVLGVVAARKPGVALTRAFEAPPPPAKSPAPTALPRPAPRSRPPLPSSGGVAVPLIPKTLIPPSRVAPKPAPSKKHAARRDPRPAARELDRAKAPTIVAFGRDLTRAARDGQLEPILLRQDEIDRTLDVLAKRSGNAPCLVGPAGAGKTSIAYGVAQRIAADPSDERIVIEISVSELVAGTGARGSLAERLGAIRQEVRAHDGRIVLFLDEIHELIAGAGEATAELKVALARGELPLIAATTPEDFRRSVESDAGLARRFTLVEIDEPNEADAFLLIRSVATGLGRHHRLAYSDEAIAACIGWTVRYLPGRALPEKAISALDLAGARKRRTDAESSTVDLPDVAEIVAELADVPLERLLETDQERMLNLEELLGERVVGHERELRRIAAHLRRNAAGLRGARPVGSFLLLGPTGVGKTETAKAIAEALFHSADAMTRLDLSEYSESHSVARLVGAPPGYVGYESGGQLTEAVRRRPYQVILLDEIEKAHRDVLEAFLPVLDEGHLTDGRGRKVDFTNTVIVLTSNLGAEEARGIASQRSVGFARRTDQGIRQRVEEAVLTAAKKILPPELFNRFDEVLPFAPLTRPDVAEIARMLLAGLQGAMEARGVLLDVDEAAIEALLDAGGFDPELGARPMRRLIARMVEAPLSDLILQKRLPRGAVARVTVTEEGSVSVDVMPPPIPRHAALA
jgi:ATP-dependent Clp protease ATP-binding subunit ClpC